MMASPCWEFLLVKMRVKDEAGVAPQNDFTPEEEEEVRRESQWAFD